VLTRAAPEATCKVCERKFMRARPMQQVCGFSCASKRVIAAKKAEKEETRARRLAIKPRSKWLAEAQAAFNAWVRARDEAAGLPCISCGRHHEGSHDAGHYLTTGARPELRFHEQNVWRQCVPCNRHLHGNLILYRVELVKRIGLAAVEKLEGAHPPMHYSVDDLRLIKHTYRAKARALTKDQQ
jgi:Bacteriophage Lambda NinG protein